MNRKRLSADDTLKSSFYQLPKLLFDVSLKELSHSAKLTYALLWDRAQLSLKNGYVNLFKEVYVFFSRAEMMDKLNLSNKTVIRVIEELKSFELIQEERQGQGKPNRIYLLTVEFALKYDVQKCNIYTSEHEQITRQEVKEVHPIKKSSKEDLFYLDSQSQSHVKSGGLLDLIYKKNKKQIEELFKSRVEYETLLEFFGWESQGVVDEVVRGAVEILSDQRTAEFSISGRNIPAGYVKETFLNLEYDHMSHVIVKFREQEHTINHKKTYIRTMLYNSYYELNLDTSNRISRDFGGRAHKKQLPN